MLDLIICSIVNKTSSKIEYKLNQVGPLKLSVKFTMKLQGKGTPLSHNLMIVFIRATGWINQSHSTNEYRRLQFHSRGPQLRVWHIGIKVRINAHIGFCNDCGVIRYRLWKFLFVIVVGNKVNTELSQVILAKITKLNLAWTEVQTPF